MQVNAIVPTLYQGYSRGWNHHHGLCHHQPWGDYPLHNHRRHTKHTRKGKAYATNPIKYTREGGTITTATTSPTKDTRGRLNHWNQSHQGHPGGQTHRYQSHQWHPGGLHHHRHHQSHQWHPGGWHHQHRYQTRVWILYYVREVGENTYTWCWKGLRSTKRGWVRWGKSSKSNGLFAMFSMLNLNSWMGY